MLRRSFSKLSAGHFDLAVVGAGVEGSWTALQAARQSKNVILLDQFPVLHSRGSSHGHSRIIRHAYAERFHAELMPRAFTEWRHLERDTGRDLLVPVPLLCLGGDARSQSTVDSMLDSLRHVLPEGGFHELDSEQLAREFPNAKFSPQHRGLLETVAGILRADECMKAVQGNFLALGGEIRDDAHVTSLHPDGDLVRINIAPNSRITAEKVAVCAGPWTAKFLDPFLDEKLPLTALRVMVYYWRLKSPGSGLNASFKDMTGDYEFWGIPQVEHTGLMKISQPWPRQVIDPDLQGQGPTKDDQKCQDVVSEYISRTLPGLDATSPEIFQPCIYTMTPDEISIIDRLPGHENIAFACGFSGSGFKKAPVIGQMLLQLLGEVNQEFDMSPFSMSRFSSK